ncbi:MAG TPA: hypothetical protein VD768_06095 [Sphingomicrobium sp.]|nr:hypothetical protein [Sphingomicrobium sp.]
MTDAAVSQLAQAVARLAHAMEAAGLDPKSAELMLTPIDFDRLTHMVEPSLMAYVRPPTKHSSGAEFMGFKVSPKK